MMNVPFFSLADNGHMVCIHSMWNLQYNMLGVVSEMPLIQIHIIVYWTSQIVGSAADIGKSLYSTSKL